jgi:hypothetical protein
MSNYEYKRTFNGQSIKSTEQYYKPLVDGGDLSSNSQTLVEVEAGTEHGSLNIYQKNAEGQYQLAHRSAIASANPNNRRGSAFSNIIAGQFDLNPAEINPPWQDLQDSSVVLEPGQEGYPLGSPAQIRNGMIPTFFPLADTPQGIMGVHTTEAAARVFVPEDKLGLINPGDGLSTNNTGILPSSGCLRAEEAGIQSLKNVPVSTPVIVKVDETKQFYKAEGDNKLILSFTPSQHNTMLLKNGNGFTSTPVNRATLDSVKKEIAAYQAQGFLEGSQITLDDQKIQTMLVNKTAGDFAIGTVSEENTSPAVPPL